MSLTNLIVILVQAGILVNMMLMAAAYMVLAERKIAAWIQNRVGPNRVGPWGLFQSFADVFKLYIKEDIVPAAADYKFHALAPVIAIGVAVTTYAIIPFSGPLIELDGVKYGLAMAPNMNIGILAVLAMTSVGVYGVALAGWSSNNKYSLMGGLRSAAQMISYELSMGLAIIGVVLIAGSLNLIDIIQAQTDGMWFIFLQPVGFILFLITALAETNRAPFDLPEAEAELVSGYNTEYAAMGFALFFLGEYANMILMCSSATVLFLGGWLPLLDFAPFNWIPGVIWFGLKVSFLLFVFIWVRASFPRYRYDQLMRLGWKVFLPLSFAFVLWIAGVLIATNGLI